MNAKTAKAAKNSLRDENRNPDGRRSEFPG